MPTGTTPATGTIRTGMTGIRPPQQRQPLLAQATQWWRALTQRQKMLVGGIALALLLIVGLSAKIQKATAYVNLYEASLSAEDINDVSTVLKEHNIAYVKTLDNHITVPPSKWVEANADLANQGIPRHPFYEMPPGANTQTHEQWTAAQHRNLERDITLVLRQFNEIADANVKLVIPSENDSFFRDEKDDAKAAVVLKLRPGAELPVDKIRAVSNFVASSVPKLRSENVQITDTNGRLLSAKLKESEDTFSGNKMVDQKKSFQQQLEAQVKQILDKALGPDKYALAVNVDLDWNRSQSVVQTHGTDLNSSGVIPEQLQIDMETYSKSGAQSSGVKQLAYSNGSTMTTNSRGGEFKKEHRLVKNSIDSKEMRTDFTPGQIRQVTASVLTEEQLSDENQRALRAAVKNAIGFNYDRGDSVSFGMLPFHRDELDLLRQSIEHPGVFRHDMFSPAVGAIAMRMTMAALVLGIFAAGVYLYRQQKARLEKTELVLAAGPTANLSDISDLLSEKTGRVSAAAAASQAAAQTQVEQLVREKPTKVAELLKTTWLAEK